MESTEQDNRITAKNVLQRHEKFWFDDGSVILICGSTAFRVHKSILSCKSAVFKDLFTVPQPDNAESMDGCPTVHLSDDPMDLAELLDAIYFMNYLKYGTTVTWSMLRPLIVIGNKYQADEIRDEAIRLLNCYYKFCEDISVWDARFARSEPSESEAESEETEGKPSFSSCTDLISMANVARNFDLKVYLQILYECCQQQSKLLVYGTPLADGSQEKLYLESLEMVLEGRRNLSKVNCEILRQLFPAYSPPCSTRERCWEARGTLSQSIMQVQAGDLVSCDPLRPIVGRIEGICGSAGMCVICTTFYVKRHAQQREEILLNLDDYIKLE